MDDIYLEGLGHLRNTNNIVDTVDTRDIKDTREGLAGIFNQWAGLGWASFFSRQTGRAGLGWVGLELSKKGAG